MANYLPVRRVEETVASLDSQPAGVALSVILRTAAEQLEVRDVAGPKRRDLLILWNFFSIGLVVFILTPLKIVSGWFCLTLGLIGIKAFLKHWRVRRAVQAMSAEQDEIRLLAVRAIRAIARRDPKVGAGLDAHEVAIIDELLTRTGLQYPEIDRLLATTLGGAPRP